MPSAKEPNLVLTQVLVFDMRSLILASGFGTRLYPVTRRTPKGLIEYKGKPLISYIVDKIPGNVEILVNVNKKFEIDFLKWQETMEREITLCIDPVWSETQSFGAVGSLAYWARDIKDDLLVIASDIYFEFELPRFISVYDSESTLVAVCDISDKTNARQLGVVQMEDTRIVGFEEKPRYPQSTYVAIPCYIFPPRVLPVICQFAADARKANLGDIIAYLTTKEKVFAYLFNDFWFDIGTPDSLSQLLKTGDVRL